MKILVTGTAGFIGAALAQQLLARGDEVIGIDNLNDYYDVQLKQARLDLLTPNRGFTDLRIGLEDKSALDAAFKFHKPERVVNLAAQAGVRYSLTNPQAYIDSNITGFLNILEACRHFGTGHLVYASSSSVYGANTRMPFAECDNVDHPLSLYAATKKSNELMAHTYSHLFDIPTTGLRFFTVYGPWGRPDMAPILFANKIVRGKAIDVFNYGQHRRDFTYIDDIVAGVIHALDHPAQPNSSWASDNPSPASSSAPYRIYNIGSNNPVELLYFIELMEKALGKTAVKNLLPMQPGDVPATFANVDSLTHAVGYQPQTTIEDGVARFIDWYCRYYKIT
ncbi:MAG TPA: NAD-dependent epimerase [Cellvibrio sp.]|nr:NAD-dependent epimerase [Cellvibrio sp.]